LQVAIKRTQLPTRKSPGLIQRFGGFEWIVLKKSVLEAGLIWLAR
jgi:hypothetical protein